jgi:hypothetical protein
MFLTSLPGCTNVAIVNEGRHAIPMPNSRDLCAWPVRPAQLIDGGARLFDVRLYLIEINREN